MMSLPFTFMVHLNLALLAVLFCKEVTRNSPYHKTALSCTYTTDFLYSCSL